MEVAGEPPREPPSAREPPIRVSRRMRVPAAGPPRGWHSDGSDAEAELDHVAVLDDVVLALQAHLAQLTGLRPGADVEQLVPLDHLGPDEPALEVGVDAPGALRRGRALEEGPGAGLLLARGQERAQPE